MDLKGNSDILPSIGRINDASRVGTQFFNLFLLRGSKASPNPSYKKMPDPIVVADFTPESSEKDFIIYGPASVTERDSEGQITTSDGLRKAMVGILKRGRFSKDHDDVLTGEILPVWMNKSGHMFKTDVKKPDALDLAMFPYLKEFADEEHLFCVGNVYGDDPYMKSIRADIVEKKLNSFSISGMAFNKEARTEGVLSDLGGYAVTLCKQGMNPYAKYTVIAKSGEKKYIPELAIISENQKIIKSKVEKMPEGEEPAETTAPAQPPAVPEPAENQMAMALKQIAEIASAVTGMAGQMEYMQKQITGFTKAPVGEEAEPVPGGKKPESINDDSTVAPGGAPVAKTAKPAPVAPATPAAPAAPVAPVKLAKGVTPGVATDATTTPEGDSQIKIPTIGELIKKSQDAPADLTGINGSGAKTRMRGIRSEFKQLRKSLGEDEFLRIKNARMVGGYNGGL